MNPAPTTPGGEARTLVLGVALLAGIGCYFASEHHVQILSTILEGLAAVLSWVPPLVHVHIPSEVLSACGAVVVVFVLGTFCVPALEKVCQPRLADMESQMRSRQRKPKNVRCK